MKTILLKIGKKFKLFYAILVSKRIRNKKLSLGINIKEKRKERIIISLTSFPKRYNTLDICIKSLMFQTMKADKIILYLSTDAGYQNIPEKIRILEKYGLTIKYGYENLMPHKKYFYAMQEYPNDIIITADDDLIYDKNLIKDLWKSYKKKPSVISARRCHLMQACNGKILPYNNWLFEYKKQRYPSHQLFSTNGAGTLFPPHSLPAEAFKSEQIKELCLKADDVWIKFMLLKSNVKVFWVKSHHIMPIVIPNTQEQALYFSNKGENINDFYISAMETFTGIYLSEFCTI